MAGNTLGIASGYRTRRENEAPRLQRALDFLPRSEIFS